MALHQTLADAPPIPIPEISSQNCPGDGDRHATVLHQQKGDKRIIIICTNRIEHLAREGAAMAANSADIERNAYRSALSGLRAAREHMLANQSMKEDARKEAVQAMDESIRELEEDLASGGMNVRSASTPAWRADRRERRGAIAALAIARPTRHLRCMSEQLPGVAEQLDPLVARVLAPNPSPFTFTGTQTYLVGTTDVAVIDPGPADPSHIDALLRAIDGRPLTAIVLTHTHRDHSPGSRPLKAATGAPIVGCAPLVLEDLGPALRRTAGRGLCARSRCWTTSAARQAMRWTPTAGRNAWGHTSNHLCFSLPEAGALFTGDHVMGWATTVVSPPDGDMAAYMASLDKLMQREDKVYYPAHGEPVPNPRRLVRRYARPTPASSGEGQIMRLLRDALRAIPETGGRRCAGHRPVAVSGLLEGSVLAHLIDLRARGRWSRSGVTTGRHRDALHRQVRRGARDDRAVHRRGLLGARPLCRQQVLQPRSG